MKKQLRLIAFTSALVATSLTAQVPWTSELFPKVNGKYTVEAVHFAGRDWRLDDYSYVGYYLGQRSLGSVLCSKVVKITHGGDISAELQQAISVVGERRGWDHGDSGRYLHDVFRSFDSVR